MNKKSLEYIGILGILFASLCLCSKPVLAQMPVYTEHLVVLTVSDGNQDRIVMYHKPSRSLLVYGHATSKDSPMQLLQIRRLENDFSLAVQIKDLDYSREGYSPKIVRELLDDLKEQKRLESEEKQEKE